MVYRAENDLAIANQRPYTVTLAVDHFRAFGVFAGFQFQPTPSFRWQATLTLLRATELLYGDTSGELIADIEADRYQGVLDLDYFYTEDRLLDRPVSDLTGYGASVDFRFDWRIAASGIQLRGHVDDAWGRIDWGDAFHTSFTVEPREPTLDDNGFINTTPTGSGREDVQRLIQSIHAKSFLELSRPFVLYKGQPNETHQWRPFASVTHTDWHHFPELGSYYSRESGVIWRFGYDALNNALSVGFKATLARFRLGVDDIRLTRAKVVSVAFAISF